MNRVYANKWVYLFLTIAVATLGFMIFDALNSRKILGLVNWMYGEMWVVKKQNANSASDREQLNERADKADARLDRMEATSHETRELIREVKRFTDEVRKRVEADEKRRDTVRKGQQK